MMLSAGLCVACAIALPAIASIASIASAAADTAAISVADFYAGKTVTIVVAERSAADVMADFYRGKATAALASLQQDSPYDLTARNAASFLRDRIPGHRSEEHTSELQSH